MLLLSSHFTDGKNKVHTIRTACQMSYRYQTAEQGMYSGILSLVALC